jgi:DNA-binding NtrC family response regulator
MAFHTVQRASSAPLKDRRILVVEDDWFIGDTVADLLAKEGATVFGPAATVEEGEQLAKYWPIEIAMMDLNLHGKRADDLVVELARKDVTVVVVTGYDFKQQVADNAFAVLKKPFTSDVLLDTLYQAAAAAEVVMSNELDPLVLDLVEWVAKEPRTYTELMEAWRTSCPRLTVWEDAVDRGFVERTDVEGRCFILVTKLGQDFLKAKKRTPV